MNKGTIINDAINELVATRNLKYRDYYKKEEEADKKINKIFGIGEKPKKPSDQSGFINIMIILFIIGFFVLLVSFIPFERKSKDVFQKTLPHKTQQYWRY